MKEFMTYFKILRVCNLGLEDFLEDSLEPCPNELMRWWVAVLEGTWVAGVSAGGSYKYPGQ